MDGTRKKTHSTKKSSNSKPTTTRMTTRLSVMNEKGKTGNEKYPSNTKESSSSENSLLKPSQKLKPILKKPYSTTQSVNYSSSDKTVKIQTNKPSALGSSTANKSSSKKLIIEKPTALRNRPKPNSKKTDTNKDKSKIKTTEKRINKEEKSGLPKVIINDCDEKNTKLSTDTKSQQDSAKEHVTSEETFVQSFIFSPVKEDEEIHEKSTESENKLPEVMAPSTSSEYIPETSVKKENIIEAIQSVLNKNPTNLTKRSEELCNESMCLNNKTDECENKKTEITSGNENIIASPFNIKDQLRSDCENEIPQAKIYDPKHNQNEILENYRSPPFVIHNPNSKFSGDKMTEFLIYKLGSHSTPRKIRKYKQMNCITKNKWGTPETNCFPTHNPKRGINKNKIDKYKIEKIPTALIKPVNVKNIDVVQLNRKITPKIVTKDLIDETNKNVPTMRKVTKEIYEITPVHSLVKRFENIISGKKDETLKEKEEVVKIKIRRASVENTEEKTVTFNIPEDEPKDCVRNCKRKVSYGEDELNEIQSPNHSDDVGLNRKEIKKRRKTNAGDLFFNTSNVIFDYSDNKENEPVQGTTEKIEILSTEDTTDIKTSDPSNDLTQKDKTRTEIYKERNEDEASNSNQIKDDSQNQDKLTKELLNENISPELELTSDEVKLNLSNYSKSEDDNKQLEVKQDCTSSSKSPEKRIMNTKEYLPHVGNTFEETNWSNCQQSDQNEEQNQSHELSFKYVTFRDHTEQSNDFDLNITVGLSSDASEIINDPGVYVSDIQDNDTPTASISMLFNIAESLTNSPDSPMCYSEYRKEFFKRLSLGK